MKNEEEDKNSKYKPVLQVNPACSKKTMQAVWNPNHKLDFLCIQDFNPIITSKVRELTILKNKWQLFKYHNQGQKLIQNSQGVKDIG